MKGWLYLSIMLGAHLFLNRKRKCNPWPEWPESNGHVVYHP